MKIKVSNSIYSREAISSALYQYSGDNFVSQSIDDSDPTLSVIEIMAKNGEDTKDLEKSFMNVLNDFQVRCDLENRFGHIRDQIVEEAFKPITKQHE